MKINCYSSYVQSTEIASVLRQHFAGNLWGNWWSMNLSVVFDLTNHSPPPLTLWLITVGRSAHHDMTWQREKDLLFTISLSLPIHVHVMSSVMTIWRNTRDSLTHPYWSISPLLHWFSMSPIHACCIKGSEVEYGCVISNILLWLYSSSWIENFTYLCCCPILQRRTTDTRGTGTTTITTS